MNDNPRPFRFTWLLGLGLLAASAAGAGWMLHSPPMDGELKTSTAAGSIPEPGTAAVSFGVVDVKDDITSVSPNQSGQVVEVFVKENDEVKEGQPLLRVDDRDAKLQLKLAESALHSATLQLSKARRLPGQHDSLLAQQRAAVEASAGRVSAAQQELPRLQKLAALPM